MTTTILDEWLGPDERPICTSPYHADLMRRNQHCPTCGDVRYPDADEREVALEKRIYEAQAQPGIADLERLAAIFGPGFAPTVAVESSIKITDEMVQRGLTWYRTHMLDDGPPEDWMRGLLEAALRP